ncbi:MAG: AraC family transcriptional regulator [Blautia sp.]
MPQSQACTFFTETQVNIAKKIEKIITSDLRQHHPAWELAEEFSISETSLKNYFRGVYGQNISVYLREIRMNKAGELLATTRLSVAEIAEQVGYLNQSKFASVFKKQFGVSPLEYRRSRHLEKK